MISYYLGANTPHGFHSLYDELLPRSDAQAVYILKGGPGCGKSTLMKRVGAAAERAGRPVEYIRCSGDPDSLDGVLLPQQGAAIVDGTAPHGMAPLGHIVATSSTSFAPVYTRVAFVPLRLLSPPNPLCWASAGTPMIGGPITRHGNIGHILGQAI